MILLIYFVYVCLLMSSSLLGMDSNNAKEHGSGPPSLSSSWYEVLNVDPSSSTEIIRKAYIKKARSMHPDKNLHNQKQATEQFQLLQQAYEVLNDEEQRRIYDNELFEAQCSLSSLFYYFCSCFDAKK